MDNLYQAPAIPLRSVGSLKSIRLMVVTVLLFVFSIGMALMVSLDVHHTEMVHDIVFAPDGQTVASASDDGLVLSWNVATGLGRILPGKTAMDFSVAFAPDGKTLAVECWDGKHGFIELRGYPDGRVFSTFGEHEGQWFALRFSPDGTILAQGGDEVRLWDVATKKRLDGFRNQRGGASRIAFSPDGKTLVTAGTTRSINVWDVKSGMKVKSFSDDQENRVVCSISISPNGKWIASASNDFLADRVALKGPPPGIIKIWNMANGLVDMEFQGTYEVQAVAFSPDGLTLAVGQTDCNVLYWDMSAHRIRAKQRIGRASVKSLAYSPDGLILAAGCSDGRVRMLHPPKIERNEPVASR